MRTMTAPLWQLMVGAAAVLVVVALAVGTVLLVTRAARRRAQRRQTSQATQDGAKADHDRLTELAVVGERARIAREMHDIVAHSLSVIIAQADGGRYASAANPAAATKALETIAETGRTALADMRRILGVLRPEDARGLPDDVGRDPSGRAAPLAPVPDSPDIDQLAATVRQAGLPVSIVRVGRQRALPPGVALTLYRICQEALTNAMKHGGPGTQVTVLEQWLDDAIVLEVRDDGRGAAAAATTPGSGLGIIGMRERAEMFGGTLTVGPAPAGGYRVRAVLPLPKPAEAASHEVAHV